MTPTDDRLALHEAQLMRLEAALALSRQALASHAAELITLTLALAALAGRLRVLEERHGGDP